MYVAISYYEKLQAKLNNKSWLVKDKERCKHQYIYMMRNQSKECDSIMFMGEWNKGQYYLPIVFFFFKIMRNNFVLGRRIYIFSKYIIFYYQQFTLNSKVCHDFDKRSLSFSALRTVTFLKFCFWTSLFLMSPKICIFGFFFSSLKNAR